MNVSRLFILVFGLVGLGMGIADFYIVRNLLAFRAEAVQTEGTVVGFVTSRGSKGGTMYTPQVRYDIPAPEGGIAASHEIRGSVSSSSRSYDIGEKVVVYYRPQQPEDGRIGSFMEQWFLPLIFSLFALVFGGIAASFLVSEVRQARMYAWLATHGMTVQARISEVGKNYSLKVNGRSPWVIRAQWQHPVTQAVHVFESENLWYDPGQFIGERKDIPVRVDADDPKRYRVDIGWLPKKA